MLRLIKIYFLFNLHVILTKCDSGAGDLSVQILDKKFIEKRRQDTRDMCKLFNSENVQAKLATDALPVNKYDKRKKELQLKEKKVELQKQKSNRIKRAINSVNPALNAFDEERVETIVDKIYDDLLEKGQHIPYRRKGMRPNARKARVKSNILLANNSRRFPFAPLRIDGPITARPTNHYSDEEFPPVRFVNAIVPYFIDSKTYDTQLSEVIMKVFDYIEKATCVRLQRLRERPTDQQSLQNVYWIYISNPAGIRQCVHSNERANVKGVQLIVFGYDCMHLGDIVHEIMHVLGFTHEHVRPDRDQYITILWDNIKPGYRKYFEVQPQTIGDGLPYDYASVLHYPARAFSKNGQATIMTGTGIKIGQREGLSEMDVEKIGMVYSNECIKRNREYLQKTCPSVVKNEAPEQAAKEVSQQEIEDYFEDRLWPFGVVNYKFKHELEFSTEERENIKAVIRHIEKETCLEFRDLTASKHNEPHADESTEESDWAEENDLEEQYDPAEEYEYNPAEENDPAEETDPVEENKSAEDTDPAEENNPAEENVLAEENDPAERNDENDSDNAPPGVVILTGSTENQTSESTDTSTSNEGKQIQLNEIEDREKQNLRRAMKDIIGIKAKVDKGKATNIGTNKMVTNIGDKGNKPNIEAKGEKDISVFKAKVAKGKATNIGAKEKVTNIGDKGNNTNIAAKGKTANVTTGKQPSVRRKRAAPPMPTRRHATQVLELSRSSEPGCRCPQPGKPEDTYSFVINSDCFNSVNDLLHVFVHTLGLDHQHNMHDRDSYLHIVWDQLTEDVNKEMSKKLPPAASVGFPYDYQSVMHYPWLQIKDGKTNIMYPIWNDGWAMGHWQGLSSTDVQKLNLLYFKQCMERNQEQATTKAS